MNIRKRAKLDLPATVMPGDTISVRYREHDPVTGEVTETVFVEDTFTETRTFDEAAIIEGRLEEDGRLYVGGILIEQVDK